MPVEKSVPGVTCRITSLCADALSVTIKLISSCVWFPKAKSVGANTVYVRPLCGSMERNQKKLHILVIGPLIMAMIMTIAVHTFVLKQFRQTRWEKCPQEVCETTFSIALQCLENIAHWQREHNTIHGMCNTLRNDDVFLFRQYHRTVNCRNLLKWQWFFV